MSEFAFDTVLVANRGEIARRIFRTAREMGLRCVAVYADADARAAFVRDADDAVRLPAGYLDGLAIVRAALTAGAGAIHPGYGFLSESGVFARLVVDAGLVWVGPAPDVIDAMGDKIAAKRIAADAQVPTLPSAQDELAATEIGFPLLVKAAAGGGGKGMRLVEDETGLAAAIAAARREADHAFGDPRVFLERYVARSRHIEVQVLGDLHGNLVHLGERECSIQRRHQKVIEEAPSASLTAAQRAEMCAAALRLVHSIGYQSAGTVEFLVDADSGEFYFLEVNTRLQVEHAVTEAVTGIDIVREQLRIASGEPLGYAQTDLVVSGHAIEARLYAEDPSTGFLPATGTLVAFDPAPSPDVRWDTDAEAGSVIGIDFDPMIAKVISHGPTRPESARRLASALERLHLGGVVTNRDFLASALRHPEFLAGRTTTDFIERTKLSLVAVAADSATVANAAVAAALWFQGAHRASALALRHSSSGWRNGRLPPQRAVFQFAGATIEVRYERRRDGSFILGDQRSARLFAWSPERIDIEIDGRRIISRVTTSATHVFVQTPHGTLGFEREPPFRAAAAAAPTGSLNAPMPGVVIALAAAVGDAVVAGQTLVILEAMKMEHRVTATADGTVTDVCTAVGQHVQAGATLLVVHSAVLGDSADQARITDG